MERYEDHHDLNILTIGSYLSQNNNGMLSLNYFGISLQAEL